VAEVNGGRLWYDEAGDGPAVLLLHGGLGDSELWEPVVPLLAESFRTIRTDLRFFGRSTGPAAPWSWLADIVGLLDELEIARAAIVGLSLGGRIAIDVALAYPGRLWALGLVAPGLGGHEAQPYSAEQEARYDAAESEGDLDAMAAVDFEVWAPLGVDDRIRQLWHATPDASPLPGGVEPRPAPGAPARERLGELAIPTLVITVSHDPPGFREIGPLIAAAASNARHVELESDHFVTLREPQLVATLLIEFLDQTSPKETRPVSDTGHLPNGH
jgi:pimeloyl-ACP methyl ester carboxylesterase